ncbi:MAG: MaoC family dehydratase [Dehalococcoidia bacterium]
MGQRQVQQFGEVKVGGELGPVYKVPTEEAVALFCRAWGNRGPNRFTDPEAARRVGLPYPLVPGIMSLAYLAHLLNQWAPNGQVKRLDVVFRQMVPHNQPITLVGVVTDKREEQGQGLVECDLYLQSQEGERLVGGKAVVFLPLQEATTAL